MKHILLTLLAVMATLTVAAQSNRFYIEDFELDRDSVISVPVMLANETAMRGFQFDMSLPEGMALNLSVSLSSIPHNGITISTFGINKYISIMTRTEIEEKVKAFLIDDLEIEEENIFPEAKLKEDMGIDSLDYVDIVVIVEKNFGFKIVPQEMANVKTLSQFYDYIESKVS